MNPLIFIWISTSRVSVLRIYPGCKKTKNDFYSTDNPSLQRRKPLSTDYTFVHSGIIDPFNSMKIGNGRGNLQVTMKFGVFSFILPHWYHSYPRLTSFIWSILLSSRLRWIRHVIVLNLGCLSSLGEMTQAIRLLWLKTPYHARPFEIVSYPIPPPGVVQNQGS